MSVPTSASKGVERRMSISSHSPSSVATVKRRGGNFTAATKKRECICGRPECAGITDAFYILDDPRGGFTSLPKWTNGKDNERNQLRGAYLRHMFPDQKSENSPNSTDIKVDYFFSVLETTNSNGEGEESEGATTREQNDTDEGRENADIAKDPKGNAGNRNKQQLKKQYIANHHFHPQIVRNSTTTVQVPQKTTTVAGRIPVKIKNGATKPRFKTSMPMYINESDLLELGIEPQEEDKVIDDSGFPLGYYFVVPNYTLEQAQHDLSISAKARRIINDRIEAKHKHQSPDQSLGGKHSSNKRHELSSSLASHHAQFVAASLEQNQRNQQQQQQHERALPSLSDTNINKIGTTKASSSTKDEENMHPNHDNTKSDEKKKKDQKIGNHANTFANANENNREVGDTNGDDDDGSDSSPSFEMMNGSKNALLQISEDGAEQTPMTSFSPNPFVTAAAAPTAVSTRRKRNADLEEAKNQLLSSSIGKTNKPMNGMEEEQEDWFSEEFMNKVSPPESSPETFLDLLTVDHDDDDMKITNDPLSLSHADKHQVKRENKNIETGDSNEATTTADTAHVASSNTAAELKEELDKAEHWFSSPLFKPESAKSKNTSNEDSESVGDVRVEGDVGIVSDNMAVDSSFDSVFEKVWSEKISSSTRVIKKEEDAVPIVRQKDNEKTGESILVPDETQDWFSPAAFAANFNTTTTKSTNSQETKLDQTRTLPKDNNWQARNIEFDSENEGQQRNGVGVDTASLVLPSKLLKSETTTTTSPSKASNQNHTKQMLNKKEEQQEKEQHHHHQQPQQHRQQQQESTKAQSQGRSVAALASNFDSNFVTAPSQKEVNDKDLSKDDDCERRSVVALASNFNSKPATTVMVKKEEDLIIDDAVVQGGSVAALANSFDSKLSKNEERPGDVKVFPGDVKVFPKHDATPNSKPVTTVTVKREEELIKDDTVVQGRSVATLANSFDPKLAKNENERSGDVKIFSKHDSWIKSKPVTTVTVKREEELIKDDAVVQGGSVAALANSFDPKLGKNEEARPGGVKVSPNRSVTALANNFDSKLTTETEKNNDSPCRTPREYKSVGKIKVDADRFHVIDKAECSSRKELSTVNKDISGDQDGDVKDINTVTSRTKLYMKNWESPTRAISSSTNTSRAGTPSSSPQRQIVNDQSGSLTKTESNTIIGGSPFITTASAFMPFQQVPSNHAAARDNIHVESDNCEEKKDDTEATEVTPPTDENLLDSSKGNKFFDLADNKEAEESPQSKEELEKNVEAILGYYSGSMNMNKVGETEDFLFDSQNYGDTDTGHTCSSTNFSSSLTASDADLGTMLPLEEKKEEPARKEEDAPDLSDEDNVVISGKELDINVEKDIDVPGADPDTLFSCREIEEESDTKEDDVPDLVDEDDVVTSGKQFNELGAKDIDVLDADLGTAFSCGKKEEESDLLDEDDAVIEKVSKDEAKSLEATLDDAEKVNEQKDTASKEQDISDRVDKGEPGALYKSSECPANEANSTNASCEPVFADVLSNVADNLAEDPTSDTDDSKPSKQQDTGAEIASGVADNLAEDSANDTDDSRSLNNQVAVAEILSDVVDNLAEDSTGDTDDSKSSKKQDAGAELSSDVVDNLAEDPTSDIDESESLKPRDAGAEILSDAADTLTEDPTSDTDNSKSLNQQDTGAEISSDAADNLAEDSTSDTDDSKSLKNQDAVAEILSDVVDNLAEDSTGDTDDSKSSKKQDAGAELSSDVVDNLAEDPTSDTDDNISLEEQNTGAEILSDVADTLTEDTRSDIDESKSLKQRDAGAEILSHVVDNLAEDPTSDIDESKPSKQQDTGAEISSDVADNLAEDSTNDTDDSKSLKKQVAVVEILSDVVDNLAEDSTGDTDDSKSSKKQDAGAELSSDVVDNLAEDPTSDTDDNISLKKQNSGAEILSDVADTLTEDPRSDIDESKSLKQRDAGAEILSHVVDNLAEDPTSDIDESKPSKQQDAVHSEKDETEIFHGTRAGPSSTESSVEHNAQDAAERYQDLHQYELNRRKTSGTHMSTEFKAMLSMLRQGSQECIQYEQFLLGMATANRRYANSMSSLTKKTISGDKKTMIKSFFQRGAQNQLQPTLVEVEGEESNNLTTLLDIHRSLADELSDASKHISEEISEEMALYRERLDSKVDNLEIRGASLLEYIESAESRVLKAWNSYNKSAEIISDKRVPSPIQEGSDSSISLEDSTDIWVKELHYRVAVNTFLAQKQEMTNLRKEVIAIEGERQLKIQEFLLNYLPRQRRAFSSFSELQKPLTNDLIVRKCDTSMEESMRETINKHITKLSNMTPEEQVQASKACSEPLSVTATMSGFTAMLVERKIGRESWHKTLAVATDSYLHLFHIPSNAQLLTSAMDAFRQLASPFNLSVLEDSSHNNTDGGSSSVSSGNALSALTPFQSFHLPKCKLNALEGGTDIEIDNADSFSRGIIQLRSPSQDEASKLMDFLKRASDGLQSQNDPSTEMLASVVLV